MDYVFNDYMYRYLESYLIIELGICINNKRDQVNWRENANEEWKEPHSQLERRSNATRKRGEDEIPLDALIVTFFFKWKKLVAPPSLSHQDSIPFRVICQPYLPSSIMYIYIYISSWIKRISFSRVTDLVLFNRPINRQGKKERGARKKRKKKRKRRNQKSLCNFSDRQFGSLVSSLSRQSLHLFVPLVTVEGCFPPFYEERSLAFTSLFPPSPSHSLPLFIPRRGSRLRPVQSYPQLFFHFHYSFGYRLVNFSDHV